MPKTNACATTKISGEEVLRGLGGRSLPRSSVEEMEVACDMQGWFQTFVGIGPTSRHALTNVVEVHVESAKIVREKPENAPSD